MRSRFQLESVTDRQPSRVVATRPARSGSTLAVCLCLVLVLGVLTGYSARAEEDAADDFDALYEDSAGQGDGSSKTNIEADPNVDTEALETVLERRKGNLPLLSNKTHHPDRYADLSKREGNWEVAPVVMGRRQDGEANPSEVMAPLGLELNRDF